MDPMLLIWIILAFLLLSGSDGSEEKRKKRESERAEKADAKSRQIYSRLRARLSELGDSIEKLPRQGKPEALEARLKAWQLVNEAKGAINLIEYALSPRQKMEDLTTLQKDALAAVDKASAAVAEATAAVDKTSTTGTDAGADAIVAADKTSATGTDAGADADKTSATVVEEESDIKPS